MFTDKSFERRYEDEAKEIIHDISPDEMIRLTGEDWYIITVNPTVKNKSNMRFTLGRKKTKAEFACRLIEETDVFSPDQKEFLSELIEFLFTKND